MPHVLIPGTGAIDLVDLPLDGIPIGTLVRTIAGNYYRLANSTDDLSKVWQPPKPIQADAIASRKLASDAVNAWAVYRQPDFPRTLTTTVDRDGWDGGAIYVPARSFDGTPIDVYLGVTDRYLTPDASLTLESPFIVSELTGPPTKTRAGSSSAVVTIGWGATVATVDPPLVCAAKNSGSLRWLYANDEVVLTAVSRLWLVDPATGTLKRGTASTLQQLIDLQNSVLRSAIAVMDDGGLSIPDDLRDFISATAP